MPKNKINWVLTMSCRKFFIQKFPKYCLILYGLHIFYFECLNFIANKKKTWTLGQKSSWHLFQAAIFLNKKNLYCQYRFNFFKRKSAMLPTYKKSVITLNSFVFVFKRFLFVYLFVCFLMRTRAFMRLQLKGLSCGICLGNLFDRMTKWETAGSRVCMCMCEFFPLLLFVCLK